MNNPINFELPISVIDLSWVEKVNSAIRKTAVNESLKIRLCTMKLTIITNMYATLDCIQDELEALMLLNHYLTEVDSALPKNSFDTNQGTTPLQECVVSKGEIV